MNFSEARFWELLALGLIAVFIGRGVFGRFTGDLITYDKASLFALGAFLLGCVSAITLGIFLAVAIGTYAGLNWITRKPVGRQFKYLFFLIPLQLLPLVYFKYADFVVNGLAGQNISMLRNLVIPVGISFYTFQ